MADAQSPRGLLGNDHTHGRLAWKLPAGAPASVASVNAAPDIKPLFREKARNSMIGRFDLWSHQDVRDHASTILAVLRAGTMPCDGKWRSEDIDLFEHWIADGMAE